MSYHSALFWLVFGLCWCNVICKKARQGDNVDDGMHVTGNSENLKSTFGVLSDTIAQAVNEIADKTCESDDYACLAEMSVDEHGLEAIKELHQQLDDDSNGDIDLSETRDFLQKDLKIKSGFEKRQKAFHQNDDMHISVNELWETWLRSEVYSWTVEQIVEWLTVNVKLPQYASNFIEHKVTGAALPRLAVNSLNYLSNLGIKDPIHKQKISLKAMDVVLFGPPADGRHYWKDCVLIGLIFLGSIGFWFGYRQNKKYKDHINKMFHDMEGLQSAQQNLEVLQKELEDARQTERNVISEKEYLEKKLQQDDSIILQKSMSDGELSQLKEENEVLRNRIQIAESKLQDCSWNPPHRLHRLLQLSYDTENKAFTKRKITAMKQLQEAKEACEKLRKMGSGFIGTFIFIHGKSIDEVQKTMAEARISMREVTQELQECEARWKQIECLCRLKILQHTDNCFSRGLNERVIGLKGQSSNQSDYGGSMSSTYAANSDRNPFFDNDS